MKQKYICTKCGEEEPCEIRVTSEFYPNDMITEPELSKCVMDHHEDAYFRRVK